MEGIKLNLGSGETELPGYINVDKRNGSEAYPLAYDDGTVEEIRASHLLEHFSHRQTMNVLTHWVQKLRPGGCLKIAVPDFKFVADSYARGEPINMQHILMGAQNYPENCHGALFDRESLLDMMLDCDLERIAPWVSELDDCAKQPYSINLQGFKPSGEQKTVNGEVIAVGAVARFGPSLHHSLAEHALFALGIPYNTVVSCFWHETLCEAMEKALENPRWKYVMTTDYDTIFTAQDVLELYRIIECCPEMDAICPVQSKRGESQQALFSMQDDEGALRRNAYLWEFQRNVTKVTTGHFGLTLFRADKLREFPRPWMEPKPNKDGRWGDGNLHVDISFWHHWRDAGNSLYLANRVVVGHLQEFISWPGKDFKPVHQTTGAYFKHGIPAEVIR
jgi:predicted SAM-dependent methyltransferase